MKNETYNEIAKELGPEWSAEVTSKPEWPRFMGYIRHNSGLALFIQSGGYNLPEKHEISYSVPRDQKGHTITVYDANVRALATPSIRLTQKKTPEQIAKDIRRRLLEDAKTVHEAAIKRLECLESYYKQEDEAKECADRLSYVGGVSFSSNGGQIHVDGYVNPDVAKQIHALLQATA